jgi:ADP-heptose:LPS heptosyltransferase
VYFNRHKHLGEAYARMIGQLLPTGCEVDVGHYGRWRFELSPLPAVARPYVVVNIHAGDLSLERRWPRESFKVLIDELLRLRPDQTVVLIGYGDEEAAYGAALGGRKGVVDLSGRLTLSETVRLIANAELVVTNDSAPLHFALSTRVKLVGLFGPTLAENYLPPGREGTAAAFVPLYCSPCVHYWEPAPCHGDNQCMKRLSVSQVLNRCCELLGIPPPALPAEPVVHDSSPSPYYPGHVYNR